jgi:anti-sigma factor RsiW
MEHDRFKEWLHLSVYDELGEDAKRQLDAHVQSCAECRREREELVRMLETITASSAGETPEETLTAARQNLSAVLSKEPVHSVTREPARGEPIMSRLFGGGWRLGYRFALAGAAMLAVGYFIGYLAFGRIQPDSPVPKVDLLASDPFTTVSNVHFVDADATDGEVELLYDEVRPARLRAPADDQRMRELLAHAILNGSNPGVRLEAINVYERDENIALPGDVKDAFLEALVSDPNAGVRRQALLVLQRLPFDDEIKGAMLFVLSHDENPGLRIAAMNYLSGVAVDGELPENEFRDILDTRRAAERNSSDRNRPRFD